MDERDWLSVKAALDYWAQEPVEIECTNDDEDTEIEHAVIGAFLAGVEYAKNHP